MNAKILSKLCAPCLAILLAAATGCSYVVDAVEGKIMNRASFSITVTPTGAANQYNVDWSDISDVDSDAFAGYEIYVTESPNDEFAGYRVIAAYYDLGSGCTVIPSMGTMSDYDTTVSFGPVSAGDVYYFRVAEIEWDEKNEDDRDKNWKDPVWDTNHEYYYLRKSSIGKISGGLRVQF